MVTVVGAITDKEGAPVPRKDQVGPSRQTVPPEPEPLAHGVNHGPDDPLRLSVALSVFGLLRRKPTMFNMSLIYNGF